VATARSAMVSTARSVTTAEAAREGQPHERHQPQSQVKATVATRRTIRKARYLRAVPAPGLLSPFDYSHICRSDLTASSRAALVIGAVERAIMGIGRRDSEARAGTARKYLAFRIVRGSATVAFTWD